MECDHQMSFSNSGCNPKNRPRSSLYNCIYKSLKDPLNFTGSSFTDLFYKYIILIPSSASLDDTNHFPFEMWLGLVGAIWLQSISGTNTDFPAYSSQLKSILGISQVQLNNLAFASDAGKIFGWVSGIAAVHLPLWLVLIIGTTLGFIGYGVQFLFLVNQVTFLAYWQIFALIVLAGNSICWINTVSYVVAIRNFPFDQQIVVGLSTSYAGLSAKLYTDVVDAVSSPNELVGKAKTYILLNSIVPLIVSIVTAPFLSRDLGFMRSAKGLEFGFIMMFIITIVTGIFAAISSLDLTVDFPPWIQAMSLGMLLAMLLFVPLTIKVRERLGEKCLRGQRVCDVSIITMADVLGMSVEKKKNSVMSLEEGIELESCKIKVIEEIGMKMMLRRVEFWLYFFVYMFGATLGMVFLNNLGQIAESRGYSNPSSLVSFSSSFGFFGRLMPSLMDYFFSKCKYMVSRTACIVTLMASMVSAFFLLLSTNSASMYISTAIIGVCTGAISSIAVSTTTELFGTKNFSVNHNVVIANIPIGSFLFGYLAGVLYQRAGDEGGKCFGPECYNMTFVIWGVMCFIGTLLCIILHFRTCKALL